MVGVRSAFMPITIAQNQPFKIAMRSFLAVPTAHLSVCQYSELAIKVVACLSSHLVAAR
jgi:hypothetical protein